MRRTSFELEDVGLDIDGRVILEGVTTGIDADGITVVLGPSGAGKSTLLRLLNRLEVPTCGTVRFCGDDVAGLDPLVLRRKVGMVFQRPTLFAGTVRDNLLVAAAGAATGTMVAALERAALAPAFLDRDGGGLSGGEAQRACLARTLITEPQVLLLDEPTSSLDEASAQLLEASCRSLADCGTTLVWVTHDLAQASRIADHTIKLERGRVVG